MKKMLLGFCTLWCCSIAIAQTADNAFAGWFRLKSQFRGADECLLPNDPASSLHSGAVYMGKVQDTQKEYWYFEKQPNGYYRIKSLARGKEECLEGNEAGSQYHAGGAFMSTCADAAGQYWKIVKEGDYYRLENQFRGAAENLESGWETAPDHSGAAYMDKKQGVTGQLWQLQAIAGDPVPTPPAHLQGLENLGDPVPVTPKPSEQPEPLGKETVCNGQKYRVTEDQLIYQQINGAWVEVGNNCVKLICNGKQLVCTGVDGTLWQYEGAPHSWTHIDKMIPVEYAGATTPGGIATYKLLQGRWQAIMDRNMTMEFTGNSLYGTVSGTGDEYREDYRLSSWCGNPDDKTQPYDKMAKEKYIGFLEMPGCWGIVKIDAANLWLQADGQGAIRKLRKVK